MNKARFRFNFLYRELCPPGKSLPPPAVRERRHRGLARRLVAVRQAAAIASAYTTKA
jgi:hypothetical protein